MKKREHFKLGAGFLFLILIPAWALQRTGESVTQVGYGIIEALPGSSLPEASALFGLSNQDGVLVSEAAVRAVDVTGSGRLFVDGGNIQTGFALVNPSSEPVQVRLLLRDREGTEIRNTAISLAARQHLARFVNDEEIFPDLDPGFTGTLAFSVPSEHPGLAAVTIRQAVNGRGEPLLATLPIARSSQAAPMGSGSQVVFPHLGAGGILSTQLILLNGSDIELQGTVRLFGLDGTPLELALDGQNGSAFPISIAPRGAFSGLLTSPSEVRQGYALIDFATAPAPDGVALFQFRSAEGELISEAGVQATVATTHARLFLDQIGTQTGIAVALPADPRDDSLHLTVFSRLGVPLASTELELGAGEQTALFFEEMFPDLPDGFSGMVAVESESPFYPVTLKLTTNRLGDPILTTLPVADLDSPDPQGPLYFPQLGFGPSFTTQMILISRDPLDNLSAGTIRLLDTDGSALPVAFLGEANSDLPFSVSPNGSSRLRPGDVEEAAEVDLDPSLVMGDELVINVGSRLPLSVLIRDSAGRVRDDLPLQVDLLDPLVAGYSAGEIEASTAGFSTLILSSQSAFRQLTLTAVEVTDRALGFGVTGIAQDLSGQVYAVDSESHTLLASGSSETPELLAGAEGVPGLVNGERLASRFRGPSNLSLDQAAGQLFVSDSDNHVIRVVELGARDQVATLAGTGQMGSVDGPLSASSFRQPRGIVLDSRGRLWVADSGNHTIRRIDLNSGTTMTVAGVAGMSGHVDGTGTEARFDTPLALAILTEPLAQQLAREEQGLPAPPLRILVADSNNRVVRIVSETGQVETLGSTVQAAGRRLGAGLSDFDVLSVAADRRGNIFTGRRNGSIQVALSDGTSVAAVEDGTFGEPSDLLVADDGELLVADPGTMLRSFTFGRPEISQVLPSLVDSRGDETVVIEGRNFSPETQLVIAGRLITNLQVVSSVEIRFVTPSLPNGRTTLSLLNRGGIVQTDFLVEAIPFTELEPGEITTVAGGSTFVGDGLDGSQALLKDPFGLALDSDGNLFIADYDNNRIRRLDHETGILLTVAGTGETGFSGDGGLALSARLNRPYAVAFDGMGNLYFSDRENGRVRLLDSLGNITTVAGGGFLDADQADSGSALEARLNFPRGLAVAGRTLFIADGNAHRIRSVDLDTGTIDTVAGTGTSGFSGDGGSAVEAQLNLPLDVAIDDRGGLLIADSNNRRIRRLDLTSGVIQTVAGDGTAFGAGSEAPATETGLAFPQSVFSDRDGNFFIADAAGRRVRRVDRISGLIRTVAGNGVHAFSGDGGLAVDASIREPAAVTVDGAGNVYLIDRLSARVRKVAAGSGIISTIVGSGNPTSLLGDGGPATTANLKGPQHVLVESDGSFLILDSSNHAVRRVDGETGIIQTLVGTGEPVFSIVENSPASEAGLNFPSGLGLDTAGNLYISTNQSVQKIDQASQLIRTLASGLGSVGDLAIQENLLYVISSPISSLPDVVVRIDLETEEAMTVVGGGQPEDGVGDGGPPLEASLNRPIGLALDSTGVLYIADFRDRLIRRVDFETGRISTVAEGISFQDVAIGPGDQLFTSDQTRIYRVDPSTGELETVAGSGQRGFSSLDDGGPAIDARFNGSFGIRLDGQGNLYIADLGNNRIRIVRAPF